MKNLPPIPTPNRYISRLALAAALGISATLPAVAQSIFTDLELSLVSDISGSVDSTEYNLQMGGYASAFRDPLLHSAISGGSRGQIAVNLVFFDSSALVGLDWTILTGASDANAFADLLDNIARPSSGGTNPASGINLATTEIFGNNIESTRQVIDVSGDGRGSATENAAARDAALAAGVDAINGLPILDGDPSLEQFFIDNIQGGGGSFVLAASNFEDFRAAVLEKLAREISGGQPIVADSMRLVNSGLRTASIALGRTMTRDVGSRLFRMRSGAMPEPVVTTAPAPYSAKGGMAKGGMAKEPIVMTEVCRWEVYGMIYYMDQDQDSQLAPLTNQAGQPVGMRRLIQPDTTVETWGGTVGFEYDFSPEWSAGFAVSGANTDIEMSMVGNADVDTIALMPYASYHRSLGNFGFYADLLYGYGKNDYDTLRLPSAVADFDGDFHTIEINTGLNMATGQLVHGPYGQLRWLDGEIDGYTDSLGTSVSEANYDSLATQLGYQVSYPMVLGGGKLIPQARAAWEHEFRDDQGSINGVPLGRLDDDLAVLGAGVGYFMNCGWNVVLDYEGRLGGDYDSHYVSLKAGVEF